MERLFKICSFGFPTVGQNVMLVDTICFSGYASLRYASSQPFERSSKITSSRKLDGLHRR